MSQTGLPMSVDEETIVVTGLTGGQRETRCSQVYHYVHVSSPDDWIIDISLTFHMTQLTHNLGVQSYPRSASRK